MEREREKVGEREKQEEKEKTEITEIINLLQRDRRSSQRHYRPNAGLHEARGQEVGRE